MNLISLINNCSRYISQEWKFKYASFLEQEHWELFSRRLTEFLEQNSLESCQLPYFNEEITINKRDVYLCFMKIKIISENKDLDSKSLLIQCAEVIESIPFKYLLIVHGLRLTSASLQNQEAIPPLRSILLSSAFKPLNDQICRGTREWEKHIGRSGDGFWGEIKGGPLEKKKKVNTIIITMLDQQTWWNIFHHYKHGLVYEIRVASGHGIRWNKEGTELIGFLEPFLKEEL